MKKLLSTLAVCCLVFLLGCTKQMTATGNPTCKISCEKQLTLCRQTCIDNCPNCINKSIYSASKNYSKYVQEQKIQGGMVIRQLKSYRDPLQCRKITCNCLADYNVCVQAKTGIIHKRLQINSACER